MSETYLFFRASLLAASITGFTLTDEVRAQSVTPQSRPLSFSDAMEMAAAASPQRAEAQADVDASTARRKEAYSAMGPKVSADFTSAKFDKAVLVPFGAESITLRPDELRQGSITARQPLVGLFAAHTVAEAAKSRQEASELNLQATKADAIFTAAKAYLDAQETDELVHIAAASVAAAESQKKDAEALSQSGRIIRSDFLKLNIAEQDARSQLAKMTAQQKKAKEYLLYLVGLPLGASVKLDPLPAAPVGESFATPGLSKAVDEATKTRLDVKQAEADLETARYGESLSRWKFAPNVDFFMKWDRVYSEPPFGNPPFTRSYGIAATWEIWDSGSRLFAAQESAAQTRKAEAKLTESKDKLQLEIHGLIADLEAAKEALAAAKATVDQSEEAYRLDKVRFGNGLVTATDLLLSESTRTKAKGTLVAAATAIDHLMLDLQKATGATRPRLFVN